MALEFRKLHPLFCAEVTCDGRPLDLRQVADRTTLEALRAGMDQYGVLVFPQQPFTDAEQLAFAERFDGTVHALIASPFKSAYVAAKHGIAGFTKSVALETATSGITANAICPGYVWTPLVERQIPDTMAARGLTREQVINDVLLHAQPTKQFVTVDEVAALAVYLAGDMARSITGSIISIDGGWTAA